MSLISAPASLVGAGSPDADLSPRDLREILEEALSGIAGHSSVLAIVADKTRDDNTDLLFPLSVTILEDRKLKKFDVLIAQGTHSPMSAQDKLAKIGAIGASPISGLGQIFDHEWMNPKKLVSIGVLEESRVTAITGNCSTRRLT